MLAERRFRGRPLSPRSLSAALALGLGLAAVGIGAAPAASLEPNAIVRVALAIPLSVPASTDGLISADDLTAYTRPSGVLTRQLDAIEGQPIAVGIDPRIIVSIRILGTSAPASAIAWLQRLEQIPNETFPLSYADSDLTASTQAGLPVLGPESFDYAIDPSRFSAAGEEEQPTPLPTPTAVPDDAQPSLPSSDDLGVWPYSLTGLAWPRDDTVITSDLPAIAAAGYSTTILSSTNLTRAATAATTAEVGGTRVLVSDSAVSAAFRDAAGSISIEQWMPAAATLSDSIAESASQQSGSIATVFATLDRDIPLTSTRVAQTVAALSADPSLTLVSISTAMGVGPSAATIVDEPQDSNRLAIVRQLLEAEDAEHRFASVAVDPTRITSERRLELLAVLSNSWANEADDWATAASDFVTESVALRSSVQLVNSSTLNLIADNGQRLPVTVQNNLDEPVIVYVTVRPETALLSVDNNRVKLELDANSQAKVNVPVRSLSNGMVEIQVTLSTGTAVALGQPIYTEVNVQAGWETPIVVIFASLVVLIFVGGIVRTVVRRRRAAHE